MSDSLWSHGLQHTRLPYLHHLPELAQTHAHWVGDATQLSRSLSSPSSPAFNLSQHLVLFQWVSLVNPGGSVVKNPTAHAGDIRDAGSIPGLGRRPGEGNGNPLQYSCLENSMDRGAWWATVHGVTKGHIHNSPPGTPHRYCKFITGEINQFFTKRPLFNDKWTLLMTGL